MNETKLLLKTYYEALYERLETNKALLATRAEKRLQAEIEKRGFGNFNQEKYTAYRDACLAFIDERIETYNPIGIQYLFDRGRAHEAFELELQLDWYQARAEFEALIEAVRAKAQAGMADERLRELADELVIELGAYPDKSIISDYEADPALEKLPDYVVARVIEETIR